MEVFLVSVLINCFRLSAFFESDEDCKTSYKDRDGKYQGQRGVTLPKT
mgnify:CR=1 FL=1